MSSMDDYKKMKVQVREAKHHSTCATLQNTKNRERERAHSPLSLSREFERKFFSPILNRLVVSQMRARVSPSPLSSLSLILSRRAPLVLNASLTTRFLFHFFFLAFATTTTTGTARRFRGERVGLERFESSFVGAFGRIAPRRVWRRRRGSVRGGNAGRGRSATRRRRRRSARKRGNAGT